MMPGFLKGIKVAAIAVVLILGVAAFFHIHHLQNRVTSLSAELEAARREVRTQQALVEESVNKCNAQLEAIRALEIQRMANRIEVEMLTERLEAIPAPRDPVDEKPLSFADELNGLNSDTNRLLEQESRKGLHASAGN